MKRAKKRKIMPRLLDLESRMEKAHDALFDKFEDDPERLRDELIDASCAVAELYARKERARVVAFEQEKMREHKKKCRLSNRLPTSTRAKDE